MPVDLSKPSGLPVRLAESHALEFGNGLVHAVMTPRRLLGLKQVLLDETVDQPDEVYFMYRDVCLEADKDLFRSRGFRYDFTVIPGLMLGKEFNKTYGHFHPQATGRCSYPEAYEVVHGRAHYLLQDREQAVVIEAQAGDKVLIPPNFGHITINPGKETLVMSNLVERTFASEYESYKEKRGGIYYETVDGWIENKKYLHHPALRFLKPRAFPELGLENEPLYTGFKQSPEKFEWLRKPEPFLEKLNAALQ